MNDTLREDLALRARWYALGRVEAESGTTGDLEGRAASFAHWAAWDSPIDGRTMHDRWLQWNHGGRHWHVVRHNEDDDPLSTYSVAQALDYAATELERIAEAEEDDATAAAKEGLDESYRYAWQAHERAQAWHGLVANLRNMAHQYGVAPEGRAPLYQDPATAPVKLRQALTHLVVQLGAEGPADFHLYEHADDECRPRPDGERDEHNA